MSAKPRLALLPGLDGTGMLFGPLLEALPGGIRPTVVTYPTDRVLSLAEHAEWASSRLPRERTVLVAESFSGLVALKLLVESPSRFESIVFVGAFAEPPRPYLSRLAPILPRPGALMRSVPSFMLRQYCLGREATVDRLNLVRNAIRSVSPEVLSARLSLVAQRHSFGSAQIKVRARYIQAAHDRLVPERCASWFRQRFDSFELTRVEGPHFLLETRPGECARIIEQALLSNQ